MKIHLIGFEMSIEKGQLSLNDHFQYLATLRDAPFKLGELDRYLVINSTVNNDYHLGLIITVKDQKTFCELRRQAGGKLVIKVNELDDDSSLMDFNFFVANKKTGKGLYQHYHNSCSPNGFGYINKKHFSNLREKTIQDEIEQIGKTTITSPQERKIRKKYNGKLDFDIMVSSEKLQELISHLKSVKYFEYSVSNYVVKEPIFEALKDSIERERTKIKFFDGASVSSLAESIWSVVKKLGIHRGRVTGIGEDDIESTLRITNNPDNFGILDYESTAKEINKIEIDEFHKSTIIETLIKECKSKNNIFETQSKLTGS